MSVEVDAMEPVGEVQKMLRDAFAVALAGRRLIMGTAVLTAVLAVLVLRMIEPGFTATLIVGPTAAEGLLGRGAPVPGPLSGSMINGLAHGAGETMSYYERFLYELTSLSVANELASQPEIMRRVFEPMWDAGAQAWGPDLGLGPRLRQRISELVGRPGRYRTDGTSRVFSNREYRSSKSAIRPCAGSAIATPIQNSPGCC
jgi:hypothetical protein